MINVEMVENYEKAKDLYGEKEYKEAALRIEKALTIGLKAFNNDTTDGLKGYLGLKASIYRELGDEFYNKKEYELAKKKYQISLKVIQSVYPDTSSVIGMAMNDLALAYMDLKDYNVSDSLFLEAMKIVALSKNANGLAEICNNFGYSAFIQNYTDEAEYLFLKSISLYKIDSIKNEQSIAANYLELAKNEIKRNNLLQAEAYLKKCMVYFKDIPREFNKTILLMGITKYRLNNFAEAKKHVQNALAYFTSKEDFVHIVKCTENLAMIETNLGNYKEAKELIKKVVDDYVRNGENDSEGYAQALEILCNINCCMGEYLTSRKDIEKVINIYERFKEENVHDYANSLNLYSSILAEYSELKEAEKWATVSMELFQKKYEKPIPALVSSCSNLAHIKYLLSDLSASDKLYLKSLKNDSALQNSKTLSTAIALNGLALNATQRNEFLKADTLFKNAIQLQKDLSYTNHPDYAIVISNYAYLKLKENKLLEAEKLFSEAIGITVKRIGSDHPNLIYIYLGLGDLKMKHGEKELAEELYQKALTIYSKTFGYKTDLKKVRKKYMV